MQNGLTVRPSPLTRHPRNRPLKATRWPGLRAPIARGKVANANSPTIPVGIPPAVASSMASVGMALSVVTSVPRKSETALPRNAERSHPNSAKKKVLPTIQPLESALRNANTACSTAHACHHPRTTTNAPPTAPITGVKSFWVMASLHKHGFQAWISEYDFCV